jgi:glycosyltransferase involved in cell wall biosynthesis
VAVVSDAVYPWHKGGKEIRYHYLLPELAQSGIDVTVFTMKWWDDQPEVVHYGEGSIAYVGLCPVLPMYKGERRTILQAVIFAVATFRLLFHRFDAIEADHMPYLQLVPLRLVAWIKRVPLIVTWHELWGAEGWTSYLGRLGMVGAMVEKCSARLGDCNVSISTEVTQQLEDYGVNASRIALGVNGVDVASDGAGDAQGRVHDVVFVGRLIRHKRVDLVLEAVRILRGRGAPLSVGIIGVGPESERLQQSADSLGIGDNIVFYGALEERSAVLGTMARARVLAFPSEREGFGMVVAESLALGTPVVTVDAPENAARHLIDDAMTGSVVPAGDAERLAEAIHGWLTASSDGDDISRAFWDRLADLRWVSTAAVYRDLLSPGGAFR